MKKTDANDIIFEEIIITWEEPKKPPQETTSEYVDYWYDAIMDKSEKWMD